MRGRPMSETLVPSRPAALPEGRGEITSRPPHPTRFRPGQSGNPRGRPRRPRALGEMVEKALGESIEATENDKPIRITKLEAVVKQFVNKAAKGDQRAAQFVFGLLRDDIGRPEPPSPSPLTRERVSEGDKLDVA